MRTPEITQRIHEVKKDCHVHLSLKLYELIWDTIDLRQPIRQSDMRRELNLDPSLKSSVQRVIYAFKRAGLIHSDGVLLWTKAPSQQTNANGTNNDTLVWAEQLLRAMHEKHCYENRLLYARRVAHQPDKYREFVFQYLTTNSLAATHALDAMYLIAVATDNKGWVALLDQTCPSGVKNSDAEMRKGYTPEEFEAEITKTINNIFRE